MASKKCILFKFVIIFVIVAVELSESSKSSKKQVEGKNSTKLVRRGFYHGASTRNGVTAGNVAKIRNMKRSPLSDTNVGRPIEDNTVDDIVSPSGPTVTLSMDPDLASTLANAGDSQHVETLRKELMEKVLDSAMKKLKDMVINRGGNASSVPNFFTPSNVPLKASLAPTNITDTLNPVPRKTPGLPKRYPTRQLPRTLPLIIRAPSTMAPAISKAVNRNDTSESTTKNAPNEKYNEHSQEKDKDEKKKQIYSKQKLDINYVDDDRSASKEIINDVLDKDQFWRIIEDDDETSLDDTEELENEELLRMLETKAKEKQNETSSTTPEPKKIELREAVTVTARPFDFRAPRRLRPEVQNFVNAVRDFFVNIYNAISGPWYKKIL